MKVFGGVLGSTSVSALILGVGTMLSAGNAEACVSCTVQCTGAACRGVCTGKYTCAGRCGCAKRNSAPGCKCIYK